MSRMTSDDPSFTQRFDHVGMSVPDLDTAMLWYCAALKLEAASVHHVPDTDLRLVMLQHPTGYRIELLERASSTAGPEPVSPLAAAATRGYGHLCLSVSDVATAHDALVRAGALSRVAPGPSGPRPGGVLAFVSDPFGNLIELIDRERVP